jgi:hypothetical protein
MNQQDQAVANLVSEGFQVVERNKTIVRLTKGPDARLVRQDGTVKRANHVIVRKGK